MSNRTARPFTASISLAAALLFALFAVNVYRAATQPITTDEAITFSRFVAPLWTETLVFFAANNHPLNTLLCRVSVRAFGVREWSLRLPSLLAGALYLMVVFRLTRRVFGFGGLFLAAVALMTLNPLVLDYLTAARGYGMALSFLLLAMLILMDCLESDRGFRGRKLLLAGITLGLCVSANLAFAFPAAALAITFFAVAARRNSFWDLIERFLVPAILVAFLILVIPLRHAEFAHFCWGADSIGYAMRELTKLSLFHAPGSRLLTGIEVNTVRFSAVLAQFAGIGLIVLMAGLAAALVRFWRRGGEPRSPLDSATVLVAGTLMATAALLIAAHRFCGTKYPLNRTALYWIPLTALAGVALVRKLNWGWVTSAAFTVATLCTVQYLAGFNTRIYGEWVEDSGSKAMALVLRQDAAPRAASIGAGASLTGILKFYQVRYQQTNWTVGERRPLTDNFDYYLVRPEDEHLLAGRQMRLLYRDPGMALFR